jgi:cysteine synthase
VSLITSETVRRSHTPLLKLTDEQGRPPVFARGLRNEDEAQIDIYMKDESRHQTGSLKHRLARDDNNTDEQKTHTTGII